VEERMELWQISLGIAFFLAVLSFVYLLINRTRRREKVIKILKEAKTMENEIEEKVFSLYSVVLNGGFRNGGFRAEAMKKEIEKMGLTTVSNIVLAQILWGISDIKALILFCVRVLVALNLTVISML